MLREAQQLLRDLTLREKEVRTEDGRWYIRRIMPYRTLDNRIDGVVITFVDITERKQAADAVVRRLAAVVESSVESLYGERAFAPVRWATSTRIRPRTRSSRPSGGCWKARST